MRLNRRAPTSAWFACEKLSTSFGHQAPEAPKPVIFCNGLLMTRTVATAGASADAGTASPAIVTTAVSVATAVRGLQPTERIL